jgi:glycosyltransferase involved in cell wall biosynthesis
VLAQRGVRLEALVVDDCVQASARAAVATIADPRLRYLRHPHPSIGRPAPVRNFGWPLTSGAVVHFMDDDDIVPEGVYAAALAQFAQPSRPGVVFGAVEPFGEPSAALERDRALLARSARRAARLRRIGLRWPFVAQQLFNGLLFIGGGSLLRRECIAAVGGYNTDLEILEDIDLLVRIARRFGISYLPRVSLRYRVGPSLMHPADDSVQHSWGRAYRRIQANYRREFGALDFYALKIAARSLLKLL